MGQPVKVSDGLILDARLMGEMVDRSIAGQIEFWARLGRAIEPLLRGDQVVALCRAGTAKPLLESMRLVDSPKGRKKTAAYLNTLPFPHFEAAPGAPGFLIRIDADGTRTRGRFINRKFVGAKSVKK